MLKFYKEIILTFDDGPDPEKTPRLLDALAKHKISAVFFVIGRNAVRYPKIVQRAIKEGHLIGSHTYSHPHLPSMNYFDAKREIMKGHEAMLEASQGIDSRFFRYPGGCRAALLDSFLQRNSMHSFFWDIDSHDHKTKNPFDLCMITIDKIKKSQGGILLFHDTLQQTVDMADMLLKNIVNLNYNIKTPIKTFLGKFPKMF